MEYVKQVLAHLHSRKTPKGALKLAEEWVKEESKKWLKFGNRDDIKPYKTLHIGSNW